MDGSLMFGYDRGRPASHGNLAAVTTRVNWDTSVQFEPSRQLVSEFSTTSVVFGPTSGTCAGSNGWGCCLESGGAATLNPTREPLKPARYQEVVSQEIVIAPNHSSLREKENQGLSAAITTPLSPARKTVEAGSAESCEVILRAQLEVSCAKVACSTHPKRKIDSIDPNHCTEKEKVLVRPSPSPDRTAPAAKRICREKTGTDWQTVLDIIKHGEEQQQKILAVIESE
ncbi:uncharacterized protein F5891DRAFT_1194783 [Suillus fuscotomentosus]|uniref:Uncharacterized protein n=1 Tax=Suillus fuscotomentosus TaxID=1912939 RepID=A0AAD4DY60_9AGAM|nr:uncharacterized protein F5891DRAFT_1194783 [Suillus fuscotomentosus]KAG1894798.1 hypothetical protein F5891DRAFT_1194783 [Suillus fuscotomentosus]